MSEHKQYRYPIKCVGLVQSRYLLIEMYIFCTCTYVSCSRHDIVEKMLTWHYIAITHSLYFNNFSKMSTVSMQKKRKKDRRKKNEREKKKKNKKERTKKKEKKKGKKKEK